MPKVLKPGMRVAIDSFIATYGKIVEVTSPQEAAVLVEDGPLKDSVEYFPLKSLKEAK